MELVWQKNIPPDSLTSESWTMATPATKVSKESHWVGSNFLPSMVTANMAVVRIFS